MKITALKTKLVKVPLAKPIGTAIHKIDSVGCVLVFLESDQGVVGESYVLTINAVRLKAFQAMIEGFAHQVEGKDPRYITAIWEDIWAEINPTGHKGVTISALSAIDTACWDLYAKILEQPLHHVFGACRDSINTYASGGLWLNQSIDELNDEAQYFIEQGFRSMKIRIGSDTPGADVERVRAVREAIGDDIELLADLNQCLTAKAAIKLGKMLEPYNLAWIEEPVAAYDLKGHSEVRAQLDTPIASGETEYTRFGMQAMIDANACDILMPDLQRIGGLTEMRRVANLAHAHNMPISTHIFTEQSLCIAGSSANCISVEHMPWFSELFNEELIVTKGEIEIPRRPGTGFTFNPEAISKFLI